MNAVVTSLAICAGVLTLHSVINCFFFRSSYPIHQSAKISILIPARNEASTIASCITGAANQYLLDDYNVIIYDDDSIDATRAIAEQTCEQMAKSRLEAGLNAPPMSVIHGTGPPPGWLGKPYACWQLAHASQAGEILVFVDSDVILSPTAVATAVTMLNESGVDLVSPCPKQVALTWSERLIQPLMQWLWLTFLPLRWAQKSSRPSTAAANGQFIVVTAEAYRRCGGHQAVAYDVLDDIGLLRAVKRSGGTGGVANGQVLAQCRMYNGWKQLQAGYGKSLWKAMGNPVLSLATVSILTIIYTVPAIIMFTGSRWAIFGYIMAVTGRIITGRRTGSTVIPDALLQPLSILCLWYLTAHSIYLHARNAAEWKGRQLID